MPEYLYQHPETLEVKSVFQKMTDEHIYIDENNVKWGRLFTKPTASIDSKIDENDSKSFVKYTSTRKGTIGELQDISKELSIKREEKQGRDEVKEQFYKDFSKKRGGIKHKDVRERELKNKLSKNKMFGWKD